MALYVGCKCDCPIIGYRAIETPTGVKLFKNAAGMTIPVRRHKKECYHLKHENLQPITLLT